MYSVSFFLLSRITGINSSYTLTINSAPLPASISGVVYDDWTNNGIRDKGEAGLQGWRVFLDANHDGTWESSEASVFTDVYGNFKFNNLNPGSYSVLVVPQTSYRAAGTKLAASSIVLKSGQNLSGLNLGEIHI